MYFLIYTKNLILCFLIKSFILTILSESKLLFHLTKLIQFAILSFFEPIIPNIRFKNVTFGYKPEQPILKNISFEAPSKKMTAIVGPSGSGKSTIARLLLGLFEVTQGQILIDDQDINSVTKYSLRQEIGIVPQEVLLFNNTLKFNIFEKLKK